MCDCEYCRTAPKCGVDFPSAVVGMKLADAKNFLLDHHVSYQIERRDGKTPDFVNLIAVSVFLEVNGDHVVAARGCHA